MEPRIRNSPELRAFVEFVAGKGRELHRDLPWRRTHDLHAIWILSNMPNTQVSRMVAGKDYWLASTVDISPPRLQSRLWCV